MSITHQQRWWIGSLLFASLALNLFFVGGMMGQMGEPHIPQMMSSPPSHGGGRGMFFERLNEKVKDLPAAIQPQVRAVLADHQPAMKEQMKAIMASRDAIDKMFASPDYSRAEAEERFEEMQEQSTKMQQMMQQMMLDIADVLPPANRAKFMERPKEWRGHGDEFRQKDTKATPTAP